MIGKKGRSVVVLAIALLATATLGQSRGIIGVTEAVWTDPEHTSAIVTSGTWPTSGYALGSAARVNSSGTSGVSILPGNSTPLPWNSARVTRQASSPGTSSVSGTGPFATSAVARVNDLKMSGAAGANSAVGASACASYVVGASGVPTYCRSDPDLPTPTASASASVSSMRLTGTVVGLNVLGLFVANSDIVAISTAAQTITASVGCNLSNNSNKWTVPSAANSNASNPYGTVLIGGRAVRIPNPNSSTNPGTIIDGLVGYSNVVLTSSQSAESQSAGYSRLTLSGSVSLLTLGLLPLTFSIDLVNAECGPGTAPETSALAQPMARSVLPAESATTATSLSPPSEGTPTTTSSESSAASSSSISTIAPTTMTEEPLVPVPGVTTSTTEPLPVEPAELPRPTTTTTLPPTTTPQNSLPTTVFSGPPDGNVEALTFTSGVVCHAPVDADYSGTIELTCNDGTSIGAIGMALTPDGVAASTVDGVWAPVLTAEGSAMPVVVATRG